MNPTNSNNKKFDAVVCLSAIDWDFLWQRTQEIMSQFSKMGYPVLFVENTGVRTPGIKDIPRVWNRLRKLLSPEIPKLQQANHENIDVFSPRALPFPYFKPAISYNTGLLKKRVLEFAEANKLQIERVLLWSYMTTPLAVEVAQSLPWAGVVVDLVSDPCKVEGAEKIINFHRQMLNLADVVFCASIPVMNVAKSQMAPDTFGKIKLFEDGFSINLLGIADESDLHGVDDRLMGDAGLAKTGVDEASKPIVAYIGGINNKIWWDAVNHMVTSCPDINFVFAGPKDYNELPCTGVGRNVFWRPPFQSYVDLGSFLRTCSAGLIPYMPSPYVAEMRPAKINEYIVTGLPIVATRMPELERFSEECGPGIVYLSDSAEGFKNATRMALQENCERLKAKRKRIASQRSWENVCEELEQWVQAYLGGEIRTPI